MISSSHLACSHVISSSAFGEFFPPCTWLEAGVPGRGLLPWVSAPGALTHQDESETKSTHKIYRKMYAKIEISFTETPPTPHWNQQMKK